MSQRSAVPLIVTTDQDLLADLVRLTAAAGVRPDVAADATAALRSWAAAGTVIVGADRAAELARAEMPRRSGVHVVTAREPDDRLFRDALGCGAESVAVLPAAQSLLVDLLADAGDGGGADGIVVGVVGGAGGVGATVFAAALARFAADRLPTLLVDVDAGGAGIDRVLGTESVAGARWDGLLLASGRLSARSLRETLPARNGLAVLTWSAGRAELPGTAAVREALSAGRRGHHLVVVDLARHGDPASQEALARCDQLLLVSTTTLPALSAATQVARRLPTGRTSVVLRGRGTTVAGPEVERLLGCPVLVGMPDQRGLDESISLGTGPLRSRRGPLARAAGAVLAAVLDRGRVS